MGKITVGSDNQIPIAATKAAPWPMPIFEDNKVEPQVVYIERPVEVIKEVMVDRPVEVIREIFVDRPVEKIVEHFIEIEKPIEVIQFIDRIKVEFKLPLWAEVVMALEGAVILALLLK